MLVWLEDISKTNHQAIRADIPWQHPALAQRVIELQKAEKGSIQLTNEPTQITDQNGRQILNLFHPTEAFRQNLRAYIASVIPALKCHMDVQTTDGKGMVLRYCASYVSKWHDAFDSDALFSVCTGPYQCAYKHLQGLRPLEPEMWMSLCMKSLLGRKVERTKNTMRSIVSLIQCPKFPFEQTQQFPHTICSIYPSCNVRERYTEGFQRTSEVEFSDDQKE